MDQLISQMLPSLELGMGRRSLLNALPRTEFRARALHTRSLLYSHPAESVFEYVRLRPFSRISGLNGFEWSDIDLFGRTLTIRKTLAVAWWSVTRTFVWRQSVQPSKPSPR